MDTLLYTKHGKPWGFIRDDFVYKNPNDFFGWIENGEIYAKDGKFIGRLANYMYVVRNKNESQHIKKPVKNNLAQPEPKMKDKPLDIIPKENFLRADEIDCLENL